MQRITGFILLGAIVIAVVLYRQAKASDGADAGKKWGWLFTVILLTLALLAWLSGLPSR